MHPDVPKELAGRAARQTTEGTRRTSVCERPTRDVEYQDRPYAQLDMGNTSRWLHNARRGRTRPGATRCPHAAHYVRNAPVDARCRERRGGATLSNRDRSGQPATDSNCSSGPRAAVMQRGGFNTTCHRAESSSRHARMNATTTPDESANECKLSTQMVIARTYSRARRGPACGWRPRKARAAVSVGRRRRGACPRESPMHGASTAPARHPRLPRNCVGRRSYVMLGGRRALRGDFGSTAPESPYDW